MSSTSQSKGRKSLNEFKFVPKAEQKWEVKQPTRNWLDLPSDVTFNILQRIGHINILENAQKVCTLWHKICKDPAMWRVICLDHIWGDYEILQLLEIYELAVDRSQGQLVDIMIVEYGDATLLQYVADRSSQLKRLEIVSCFTVNESWIKVLKKFPVLEEFNVYLTNISKEAIEAVGRYCPLIKTLKLNHRLNRSRSRKIIRKSKIMCDEMAMAVGKYFPNLRHLELINKNMSNIGLQMILDGCFHLESLDLRGCFYIDLKGDLGRRCSEQIQRLKLPNDSLEGCPYIIENNEDVYDPDSYEFVNLGAHHESRIYDDDDDEDDDDSRLRKYNDFVATIARIETKFKRTPFF